MHLFSCVLVYLNINLNVLKVMHIEIMFFSGPIPPTGFHIPVYLRPYFFSQMLQTDRDVENKDELLVNMFLLNDIVASPLRTSKMYIINE